MTILDEIVASVREDLEISRRRLPPARLRELALQVTPPADFAAALRPIVRGLPGPPRIIAELKKASPSRGVIRRDFGVISLARELAAAGAAALSVLTEPRYFQGSPEYLRAAAGNVAIPVLRKDFIIDEYQLYEARAWGASAVLLIAAALPPAEFARLQRIARELGLDVLAEVHNEIELEMVLDLGADIVGVNSRNLKTFEIDAALARRLLSQLPPQVIRVAESGVRTAEDIRRLQEAGADAFLVGETLMRAASPGRALARLLGNAGDGDGRPESAGAPGGKALRMLSLGMGVFL